MNLIQIRNIFIYLSMVGFFFFPFYQTWVLSFAFLLTFFTGEFKQFIPAIKKNKAGLVFVVFFLLHLVSLFYTEDISNGWKGIEVKLSFLAFPLFIPIILYSGKLNYKILFKILVISGVIYFVASFLRAGYNYSISNDLNDILSSNLGYRIGQDNPFVHPTYVSMYFNFLITFLTYYLLKNKVEISFRRKITTLLIIALFLAFIIFSYSKLVFLVVGVNAMLLFSYYALSRKKIKKGVLLFSIFSLISVTGIYNSPLKLKFQQAYKEVFHGNKNASAYQMSTGTRIWTWKATIELIKEKPIFGTGIGDIRADLENKYLELEISDPSRNKLDSHQQFLQTFATLGIAGILCLLFLFFILFKKGIKTKNFLLFSLTLFYFLFGITESMLETQGGIVFFTFFALVLYNYNPANKTKNE